MSLTHEAYLNMVPGDMPAPVIKVSQYDTDFVILFHLVAKKRGIIPAYPRAVENDEDVTVNVPTSGTTVEVRGTKTDGNGYSANALLSGTATEPIVTVNGAEQMTACAGRNVFEVKITNNSKVISTSNFILEVERAAMDKDTVSASEIREIIDTIDRTDEFLGAARSISADRTAVEKALSDAQDAQEAAETAAENASDSATNASESASDAAQSASSAAETLASAVTAIGNAKSAAITDIGTALTDALDDINDASQTASETLEDALEALETAKTAAVGDVTDTKVSAMAEINQKAQQIVSITTNAEQIASEALNHATDAENEVAEFINSQGNLKERVNELALQILETVNNGYVENGTGYFCHDNEVLFTMTGMGGGGGGGDQSTTTMAIANTSGWVSKTIESKGSCPISFTWSSLQDEMPTGDGTLQILVDRVVRASFNIKQGQVTRDVASYLRNGANVVTMKVIDLSGNSRSLNFNVTKVVLSLSSYFDTTTQYSGPFVFTCTPTGNVEKTLYYYVDGNLLETKVTSLSNKDISITVPAQTHGAHSIRVYFTAEINGETVQSNELFYEFVYVDPLSNEPIITSNFTEYTQQQYSTVQLPYQVYDPNNAIAEVVISVNGEDLPKQNVDRTEHVFAYRANEYGTLNIKISCRGTEKTFEITVTESEIDIEPVTENLALYLTSEGRSNNTEDRAEWKYGNIESVMTGFNWTSDGWVADSEGVTCLRVTGDARVAVPYKMFSRDFRTTGKTIEIEFATRNVLNYDATILSCMSGGKGLKITAQKATLTSEQSEISTQYKEDEHVRLAFVCRKRAESRLLFIYINGIASGVVAYPDDDDFTQVDPVDITIGSNDCTIDIYNIRVYDNNLTSQQIVENWIADTQDGSLMLDRYTRNNVYDAYGNITISKLPSDLPYLIISAPVLPSSKGDKKPCSGTYVDPVHPSKGFTFLDAEIDIQGTSSQYYPRKNWKIKFNGGFDMNGGSHVEKYAMNDDAIPVKTFCFKADVASSEGANNVELVRLYESACKYKTPAQELNSKVRQGIDGFPIVIFYDDGEETTFMGKYNFNNDKSTEDVFGFAEGDESWETLNNTGLWALWKTADYSDSAWLTDYEARYPDTKPAYENPAKLQAFAEWIVQTDRTAATGDALPESVTYGGTTYTNDTAEYRLAKFKAEAGNYIELESAQFYWLFTELFLMVDSRAKNAFPSFIGKAVNQ